MTATATFTFVPSPGLAVVVDDPLAANDACTEGVALLLEQFRGRARLEALLCSYLERISELELAIVEVRNLRDLDSAAGEQLDVIGRIVGESREGRTDDDYRRFLRVRILINKSTGTPEELIAAAVLVTQPDAIELVESFPAFVTVTAFAGGAVADGGKVNEVLQLMKPAGVGLLYVFSATTPEETFKFATGTTVETSAVFGFDAGQLGGTL